MEELEYFIHNNQISNRKVIYIMRIKRIDLIEQYVFKQKSVSIDSLCENFDVSKNTIRRDIDFLVKKGSIQKVYGGVIANEHRDVNELIPFEDRHITNSTSKDMIARTAAMLVEDNDTIYIDTGTTSLNMIDYIKDKKCTIITNNIQVIFRALPYSNINVISLPGTLKRETLSLVGTDSVDFLRNYNINKAFMACTGISISNGLTNATTEEYQVKKAAVENTRIHYVLADHTKFNKVSLMTYCTLNQIQHVITDELPDAEYIDFFKENSITLHLPE